MSRRFLGLLVVAYCASSFSSECLAQSTPKGSNDSEGASTLIRQGIEICQNSVKDTTQEKSKFAATVDALEAAIQKAEMQKPKPANKAPEGSLSGVAAPASAVLIQQVRKELQWIESYGHQSEQALEQAKAARDPSVARVYLKDALIKADAARDLVQRMNDAVRQSAAVAPSSEPKASNRPSSSLSYDGYALRQLLNSAHLGESQLGRAGFGEAFGQGGVDPVSFKPESHVLVSATGQSLNVRPLQVALDAVMPRGQAIEPLFKPVPVPNSNSLAFRANPQVLQAMSSPESRQKLGQIGGVALDVTLDLLDFVGVPGFRNGGPLAVINAPILLSLGELYDRVSPFARNPETWDRLPEEMRYPADIERIYGFVLDARNKDIFLVGSRASAPANRIDIDSLIVALQSVWKEGSTPAVSLDFRPGDPGGPQYSRVIGVPNNSTVAKVMLEADYELKRILFGVDRVHVDGYRSLLDVLQGESKVTPTIGRFWFFPRPLAGKDIHVSTTARTMLFDTGVQVLTESEKEVNGALVGTGGTSSDAKLAADLFTRYYERIERSPDVASVGIFLRLHGLVDVVTLSKLWRIMNIDYPILEEFSRLPVRQLTGIEKVPAYFPGITTKDIATSGPYVYTISGGVQIRPRANHRSLDQYQDVATAILEHTSDTFPRGKTFKVSIPVTLTVSSSEAVAGADIEQKMVAGRAALAAGNYGLARQKFTEITAAEPSISEAWANLALAQSALGQHQSAIESIREALTQEPGDREFRMFALRILQVSGFKLDLDAWDESIKRDLSTELSSRALLALHSGKSDEQRAYAESAITLWEDNPEAYLWRAATWPLASPEWTRDTERAINMYRRMLRQTNDQQGSLGLALALVSRGFSRLIEARATHIFTDSSVLKNRPAIAFDMLKWLDSGVRDVAEARRLCPSLPLAPATEGELRLAIYSIRSLAEMPSDLTPARQVLDQVVRDYPTFSYGHYVRAQLFLYEGSPSEAVREVSEAIRLDGSNSPGLALRAHLYAEEHNCPAARVDIERMKALGLQVAPELEQVVGQCK